jgi:CheY-like chemotaxis protein
MVKKKILLVDDEKNLRILVKEVLSEGGYTVRTVASGVECLKKLKTFRPDLIIMDMMMPKMSGYDTIKEIRKDPKNDDIRIVVLTVSKVAEAAKFQLSKYNVSDYINKPFDNEELIKRLKKFI